MVGTDWANAELAAGQFVDAVRQNVEVEGSYDRMLKAISIASGHNVRRLDEEHGETLIEIQNALRGNNITKAVGLAQDIEDLVRGSRATYPKQGLDR